MVNHLPRSQQYQSPLEIYRTPGPLGRPRNRESLSTEETHDRAKVVKLGEEKGESNSFHA